MLTIDILAAEHSNQRHINSPQVISTMSFLEREKQYINNLITQLLLGFKANIGVLVKVDLVLALVLVARELILIE